MCYAQLPSQAREKKAKKYFVTLQTTAVYLDLEGYAGRHQPPPRGLLPSFESKHYFEGWASPSLAQPHILMLPPLNVLFNISETRMRADFAAEVQGRTFAVFICQ